MANRVCVGAIVGAHGVRGAVRVKSLTERAVDIAAYGPVEDDSGRRRFDLKVTGEAKGLVVAQIVGIADRTAAEGLKGVRLYVSREVLPETQEDEFLYADLVGLRAEAEDGSAVGVVRGVADFGAGEVLDIVRPGQPSVWVPFTKAAVPVVDVPGGRLVVIPPSYAPDEDEDGSDGER